jgi:hypothetical protein
VVPSQASPELHAGDIWQQFWPLVPQFGMQRAFVQVSPVEQLDPPLSEHTRFPVASQVNTPGIQRPCPGLELHVPPGLHGATQAPALQMFAPPQVVPSGARPQVPFWQVWQVPQVPPPFTGMPWHVCTLPMHTVRKISQVVSPLPHGIPATQLGV